MTNGKADEGKTPTEGFLARIKELAWLGTAVAAIVTAVWAATTYLNDKRLEYVKTFSEKQIALSFETAETVANLLTAETQDAWDTHVAKFRNLYWGPLVLVESAKVEAAMFELCKQMSDTPDFSQRNSLRDKVFGVSAAIREQIRERNAYDWRIAYIDLPASGPRGFSFKIWDGSRLLTKHFVSKIHDHRVIEGALGAELLAAFKAFIEDPVTMLV